MQKIMIVEDDDIIASEIKKHLERWNYQVDIAVDFEHVLDYYLQNKPELILLDLSLPFYNGYHWCQQIRKVSSVPIIFISSANENMNIVMAMTMGGDDFITKPFDFHVLTAKIQALLRRTYSFCKSTQILTYKKLILNIMDATISYQTLSIDLTKNELKILQTLFEKAERFVSRDELIMNLWQSNEFIDDNTLSVNMNRLRKKLAIFHIEGIIQTKKGLGYKLYYE